MKLNHLKVLRLPEIEYTQYSPSFIEFVERLKPQTIGMPLKDILGKEEWERMTQSGDWLIKNGKSVR